MRLSLLLVYVSIITFYSCAGKNKERTQHQNVPQALDDNKRSEYSFSSKGRENIIEELYKELVKETPALQELDKSIHDAYDNKRDSLKPFEDFDRKNNSYYSATESYINGIKDSVLKQSISTLISNSLQKYSAQTQPSKALIESLANKDIKLSDLYSVLKLTKTVAIMEKYQQTNLPSTHPLQVVNRDYDKVIEETKKLTVISN